MIVLAFYDDGVRRMRIVELKDDRSRLYIEDQSLYTHIDHTGANLLGYVEAMRQTITDSPRVLLLGTAGGALATALSRGGADVTAVDDTSWAFDVARRWFHLPEHVECVHADALAYLEQTTRQWSAIAVDLFRGQDVPAPFRTLAFAARLVAALEPGGVIVWNFADGPTSYVVSRVSRSMRRLGFQIEHRRIHEDDWTNTVLVCRAPRSPALEGSPAGAL